MRLRTAGRAFATLAFSLAVLILFQDYVSGERTPGPQSYFDTSRTQKIVAAVVTDVSQVEEVFGFSNAFAPLVTNVAELGPYLRANGNRMLPIVGIETFLLDQDSGVLRNDYGAALSDIVATVSSNHSGAILFYLDELLWDIRLACGSGKQAACAEVARGYVNTLEQVRVIGRELRRRIPGSGMMQVEPFAELNRQMAAWGGIVVFDEVEYLAFNCYGAINSCGGRPQREYLEWILSARSALESSNPIGRKIFLVPAAFRDFYAFPDESLAIDQLRPYFETLDSSEIYGGIGAFSWGNLADGPTVFLGARSLPELRRVLVEEMRARAGKDVPPGLPPALSLVGAFRPDATTWHGSFTSISVPPGTDARLYVQTLGMDACTLALTGQAASRIALNDLQALVIASRAEAVVEATADCTGSGRSFRTSVRFEFQ